MPNLVEVEYARNGKSINTNDMGMREMQVRAFEARNSQYLLIKAPPASGKSRALMFLGLDKLYKQGLSKVIVAVPERSIGASFDNVELTKYGFFEDWIVEDENNLTRPGGEQGKVKAFQRFMENDTKILICTHATLRFAYEELPDEAFNNTLLAIDEFHHVSADGENRLGEVIRSVMKDSNAHIVAMTGSYFRGDAVPVLLPGDEAKFSKVTYNYYEQLNGYKHLKSLGIGYHFYSGRYTSAIEEVLDTDKKTILHIPHIMSGESTKEKHNEVDTVLDIIGEVIGQDQETGVISVKRHKDGKVIKVADLVDDRSQTERDKIVSYLRTMSTPEDMDLIIALGMAKEGFDWPYCEHALTVGYRGSLTEIIQIIGRCTRDSENKTHAQFTNLIAQPDATDEQVKVSVNNMLKAITVSLLMEQVLAPNFKFKTKKSAEDTSDEGTIFIKGFKEPKTARVQQILEADLNDIKARIFQDPDMLKAMPGGVDAEVINNVLVPKIIREVYPDLDDEEVDVVRQHVVVDSAIKNGEIKEEGDKKFVRMAGRFVNIEEINIDLIDTVNPFKSAFEILSKSVTTQVLRAIQDVIDANRLTMSEEEARMLWPKIQEFAKAHGGTAPNRNSHDSVESRLGEALLYLQNEKRRRKA